MFPLSSPARRDNPGRGAHAGFGAWAIPSKMVAPPALRPFGLLLWEVRRGHVVAHRPDKPALCSGHRIASLGEWQLGIVFAVGGPKARG